MATRFPSVFSAARRTKLLENSPDMIGTVAGDIPDESLVLAARSGRREALDELTNRHFGLVYAIALGRLSDREQAEELTQEVFLRVCLLLDRLQDPALFSHWISRITRNMAIDWQRRGSRASRLLPMVPLDDVSEIVEDAKTPTARDEAADKEHASALHEALARLRAQDRELLLLHYMEGMSQSEIAERLGLDKATVSRRLARSVKHMRGLFDQVLRQMATGLRPRAALQARVLAITAATIALPPATKSAMAVTAAAALKSGSTGTVAKLAGASAGPGIMSLVHAALLFFKSGGTAVSIAKSIGFVAAAGVIAVGGYYLTADQGAPVRTASAPAAVSGPEVLDIRRAGGVLGKRVVMRMEVSMETKMEMEMPAGMPSEVAKKAADSGNSNSHVVEEFAVTRREEPGGTAVTFEILSSQGEMEIGQEKIEWGPSKPLRPVTQRSPRESQLATMIEGMQARVGKRLIAHLSAAGKLERYEGAEELAAATGKTDARAVAEELVKQFGPMILPDKPVRIGETWTRTETQKLGATGEMSLSQECRFAGWEMLSQRRVAVIEITGTIGGNALEKLAASSFDRARARASNSSAGAEAPVPVSNSSFKSKTLFDPEMGIVVDSNVDLAMTVEMTVPAGPRPFQTRTTTRNLTRVSLVSVSDAPGK